MKKEQKKEVPPPEVDFSADAGVGMEGVRPEDLGIPFLMILQSLSPQLKKNNAKYIEGAAVGQVMLSTSGRIIGDDVKPFKFVPFMFTKAWVEWKERSKGGGFVFSHTTPQCLSNTTRNEKGQYVLPNTNVIVETAYFQGYYFDEIENEWRPGVIGMSSTQLKKSRQWLNVMTSLKMETKSGVKYTPPMFARQYLINTVPEHKGENDWFGWNIVTGPINNDTPLIGKCRQMAKEGVKMLAPSAEEEVDPADAAHGNEPM